MDSRNPVDAYIENQLDTFASALENDFDSDVLSLNGGLIDRTDDLIREMIESKRSTSKRPPRLAMVLTTSGGYIDVVHRIVDTIRHHYEHVDFIVPNHAYSAGTVLVMSGDVIHMDYYSRLGPIDPQVQNREGRDVPALGYLIQWERLIEKAKSGSITLPEIEIMRRFDQAELYQYEQERALSIELLEDWLTNYKFKNWKVTETRKQSVTEDMRRKRASEIAAQLNDTDRWHIHGFGISMDVLNRDLKLLIDDFGCDKERSARIRDYHKLLDDYIEYRDDQGAVHMIGHYRPYNWEEES